MRPSCARNTALKPRKSNFCRSVFVKKSVQKSLSWAAEQLNFCRCPQLEAELLLCNILKIDRSSLKTHPETQLSPLQRFKFLHAVHKRQKHVPIAYIQGKKHWAGLELIVNQHTLIPRDETEILCEHITQQWTKNFPRTILDIGTGCGAIALYMKKTFPRAAITATDIAPSALRVARKNAKKHHADITFLCSDMLTKVPQGHYDLLIANLPYVPDDMPVEADLSYEPSRALYSGKDGLDHYRQLSSELEKKDITFQQLWIEFLPQQKDSIAALFSNTETVFYEDAGQEYFFARITPFSSAQNDSCTPPQKSQSTPSQEPPKSYTQS